MKKNIENQKEEVSEYVIVRLLKIRESLCAELWNNNFENKNLNLLYEEFQTVIFEIYEETKFKNLDTGNVAPV